MAVVKANYVKQVRASGNGQKANIRYIQERPGRDKEKLTRTLFGAGRQSWGDTRHTSLSMTLREKGHTSTVSN